MIRKFVTTLGLAATLALPLSATGAAAEEKTEFSVCWSIYVGWMPWGYLSDSGIMKKWADKYGITIDAIILKDKTELADIAGQNVNLVELSVSHYLLARALDSVGLSERDLTVVNTSDADMIAAYGTDDVTAVVTWNPLVSEILEQPNATKVFDSAGIPGEIIDAMMVNTETLDDNPAFGKALVGAWYEVMGLMASGDEEALTAMAEASGTDLAGYKAQLDSTEMFFAPADAVTFTESGDLPKTMQFVAEFLFDKGILGEGAPSPEFVGVSFPDGSVYGDEGNVKLRFDTTYMQMAADGAL